MVPGAPFISIPIQAQANQQMRNRMYVDNKKTYFFFEEISRPGYFIVRNRLYFKLADSRFISVDQNGFCRPGVFRATPRWQGRKKLSLL